MKPAPSASSLRINSYMCSSLSGKQVRKLRRTTASALGERLAMPRLTRWLYAGWVMTVRTSNNDRGSSSQQKAAGISFYT